MNSLKTQTILFLLFIFIVISSCSNPMEAEDNTKIFPGKGIDKINLGDSVTKVRNEYGDKCNELLFNYSYNGQQGTVHYIEVEGEGITFYFSSGVVDFIVIKAPYSGVTEKGIGIGSTEEEVENKYGSPDSSTDNTFKYNSFKVSFKMENGQVVKIYI